MLFLQFSHSHFEVHSSDDVSLKMVSDLEPLQYVTASRARKNTMSCYPKSLDVSPSARERKLEVNMNMCTLSSNCSG